MNLIYYISLPMSQINKILSSDDSEVVSYVVPILEKKVIKVVCATIAENNKKMFGKLIEIITNNNKINIGTENIRKMILCAITHGQHEILEFLMSKCDIVTIEDNLGYTFIYHAMDMRDFNDGRIKCILLLIKAGCRFNDHSTKYTLILELIDSLIKGSKINIFDEETAVDLPTE